MNVPSIYDLIFIPKNAGKTFTNQNGINGINLKDMRYNISFFLKSFSRFFKKELAFFLKMISQMNLKQSLYLEKEI